jgi:hypothetical protein
MTLLMCCHVVPLQWCVCRLTALCSIELKSIRKFAYANALSTVLLLAMIMVLIVLTTYFHSHGSSFNPSTEFTTVSLLLSIRYTLFTLPAAVGASHSEHYCIMLAYTCCTCIKCFMILLFAVIMHCEVYIHAPARVYLAAQMLHSATTCD